MATIKSIEEKAKAYDEAFEKLRSLHDNYDTVSTLIDIKEELENIFPELKESEDERIRKALLEMVHDTTGDSLWVDYNVHKEDAIAWLEKQGEQKPAENKGMNLVEEEMTPFQKKVFCIIDTTIEEEQGLKQVCDELLTLASNEIKQKPTTEMKSPEESLGIDSDTYNKIVDECIYGEQKFAEWSEEDEHRVKDIIYFLDTAKKHYASTVELCACIDWLKSLRPKKQWKPTKEQMDALLFVVQHYTPNVTDKLAWDSIKILELMYYEIKQ